MESHFDSAIFIKICTQSVHDIFLQKISYYEQIIQQFIEETNTSFIRYIYTEIN